MKSFINDKEEYIIRIPNEWHLFQERTDEESVKQTSCFIPYDKSDFSLNISYIKPRTESQINSKDNLDFKVNNVDGKRIWTAKIGDSGIALISLTYDTKLAPQLITDNLNKAECCVKSMIVLNAETKDFIVPKIRWDNFMLSFGASIDLVNRAYEKGSSFELVILLANQIDALLRQAIILTRQLKEKNNAIDVKLIYQIKGDKPIFEKTIYNIAYKENIISDKLLDELNCLYEIRNRTVHRFIISDIKTNKVIELAWSYTETKKVIGQILIKLEKEQFDKQIGIYNGDSHPDTKFSDEEMETYIANIKDKHGNKRINERITIEKNDG